MSVFIPFVSAGALYEGAFSVSLLNIQGLIQAQFDNDKKIRPKMFFVAKINTSFSC